ncbi:hypothetical protein C8F04DRAFT_1288093 [Mycena alexandri]|uniref:Uncharacterized protein n=1 Tax=Mycena alexandri TaxID=1745969 RepID=A0AAD6SKB8_9AGAR|nr:hypothetical protein C8F04DRAFT_1288093 [Mycena alexandri]
MDAIPTGNRWNTCRRLNFRVTWRSSFKLKSGKGGLLRARRRTRGDVWTLLGRRGEGVARRRCGRRGSDSLPLKQSIFASFAVPNTSSISTTKTAAATIPQGVSAASLGFVIPSLDKLSDGLTVKECTRELGLDRMLKRESRQDKSGILAGPNPLPSDDDPATPSTLLPPAPHSLDRGEAGLGDLTLLMGSDTEKERGRALNLMGKPWVDSVKRRFLIRTSAAELLDDDEANAEWSNYPVCKDFDEDLQVVCPGADRGRAGPARVIQARAREVPAVQLEHPWDLSRMFQPGDAPFNLRARKVGLTTNFRGVENAHSRFNYPEAVNLNVKAQSDRLTKWPKCNRIDCVQTFRSSAREQLIQVCPHIQIKLSTVWRLQLAEWIADAKSAETAERAEAAERVARNAERLAQGELNSESDSDDDSDTPRMPKKPKWAPITLALLFGGAEKPRARKPSARVMEEEEMLMQALADEEEDAIPDDGAIEVNSDEEYS